MSGFISKEITANYPERVEKLILCSTHWGGAKQLTTSNEVMKFLIIPPEGVIEFINGFLSLYSTKNFIENNSNFIESYK